MDSQHTLDLALFYIIMCYITLFLKETKSGWNISSKYIIYPATAATFIFSGLFIGFSTMFAYIIFCVIILTVCLPFIHMFLKKWRNN